MTDKEIEELRGMPLPKLREMFAVVDTTPVTNPSDWTSLHYEIDRAESIERSNMMAEWDALVARVGIEEAQSQWDG